MGCCTASKKHQTHFSTIKDNIYNYYTVKKILGSGHFGVVRLCFLTSEPSRKYAIKSIDKTKLMDSRELALLRGEIDMLQSLDHPNIIKLYEVYEDKKYLHLVTEYCKGGDLLEKMSDRGLANEHAAASIMTQILLAVSHLHHIGICHRDLKPDNFMFATRGADSELKLIDFGLSGKFTENQGVMREIVGTPYYIAPEVLRGNYSFKCDLWSVGVIFYFMLSGTMPFIGHTQSEVFNKIILGRPSFAGRAWSYASSIAKDLVKMLLRNDPKSRITANRALKHQWFSLANKDKLIDYDPSILETLKNYKTNSRMQREAMSIIVRGLDSAWVRELKEAFTAIDTGNTGFLSMQEVQEALQQQGSTAASEELAHILANADSKGDGRINYSEFLAATMNSRMRLNEEILWYAFNYFDIDKSQYITAENLLAAFNKLGREMTLSEAKGIVNEVDFEHDNQISFEEFKKLMHLNS